MNGTLAPILENKKLFFGASGAALFLSCFEYLNHTV
jgi:hypothetical protein